MINPEDMILLRLKAVYRKGAFVPETACDLPEKSRVELIVRGPRVIPAEITDPEEKKRHLQAVVAQDATEPDSSERATLHAGRAA